MTTTSQAKRWCFTLNNYTPDELDAIPVFLSHEDVRCGGFGREVGHNGTPHLQGWFCLHAAKRITQIKAWKAPDARHDAAPPLSRAFLTIMRGSVSANIDYCSKDDPDYEQFGEPTRRTSTVPLLDQILEWGNRFIEDNGRAPTKREIALIHPKALIQYRNVYETLQLRAPAPVLREGTPNEWQLNLENALQDNCTDDRSILFYVDQDGGTGKSWFQQYFYSKYSERTQILSTGKIGDIAYAIETDKDIFLFNVPRGGMEFFCYRLAESLKDRTVWSPKYESGMKFLTKLPHVVVFCNEHPDMEKLSQDRYNINNL